jgi:hypothetical protein
MLANTSESHLISCMGWVDAGAVWVCETTTGRVDRVRLGEARYLSLRPGSNDLFAAVHHYEGSRVEISAHRIASPGQALSRVVISGEGTAFGGDLGVW